MYRLQLFLGKVYVLLIFLILEGFAFWFYSHSTVHSQARLLAASDGMVRSIYAGAADVGEYFSLAKTNRALTVKVEDLENELAAYRETYTSRERAAIVADAEFPHTYVIARVVRGTVNRRENFLMVDKGTRDGVEEGMAVVSLEGCMVGYVEAASARNAICVSVLNSSFRASGVVASTGHMGSISWNGGSVRTVKLSEVPKYAEIAVGDTILTSSLSFHFPEGLFVGTIESFEMVDATASYNIDVRLGADMAALDNVLLIESPELYERIKLEEEVFGETVEE